ncbi:P-loop NTPase fold protein [Pseudomonas amygdali]|uniref:KAP family P-loop NTPase fold protein n=1 Tax=Pseudomonas amygdali TaxID=47877 RepID=UPI000EFF574F|nr:P-loop NTPase fold protein [Pseudomonas amygdali]RMV82144.1 KAP P-loop domain protein [Pseudomonas amygdali pv. sesami]
MWVDNETEKDFLNFSGVADTVAEIIYSADGRPISIGVSGAWGAGKSSMIKLIQASLQDPPVSDEKPAKDFVFVEFNAWLYQGYDDARAALMDVIATRLEAEAQTRKKGLEKVAELAARVDWLRAAKLVGNTAFSVATGAPTPGLLGEIVGIVDRLRSGEVNQETIDGMHDTAVQAKDEAKKLWRSAPAKKSPPKEIQALRDGFESILDDLGVTLVVLIDDLDRCLPETTISTLEAIRLFLFLRNTAFVIAADNEMIKHAVRRHFSGVPDDVLVTSYFDKLIQVPIRVPPLGTQEVRAYMMMLFLENSALPKSVLEDIRIKVRGQLRTTWQGNRVDRAFMQGLYEDYPPELIGKFDTAERLAAVMTSASGIQGNPRLIKRFLNALAIRMTISRAQGVGVDEAVLVKLMLFERSGNPKTYEELMKAVATDKNGKPLMLGEWEADIKKGKALNLAQPWDQPFVKEWLALPPALADKDLRGAIYVSREHAPIITDEDRLSSEATELLAALLEMPEMAPQLKARLAAIAPVEINVLMDRLLDKAGSEQEWGVPAILDAMLVVASLDAQQGVRLAAFLKDRPPAQIQAGIVPKLTDEAWSKSVYEHWASADVGMPVKAAIRKLNGNVTK